jgi:hypothetical protein
MTTTILPEAFQHLHKAHVALCELAVLRMHHGHRRPSWPRLTMAKLREAGACSDGLRVFRDAHGSRGVILTPFMCQALAARARNYIGIAAALLRVASKPEASQAAARLETAEREIAYARRALERWREAEGAQAFERWPELTPDPVSPPWPRILPDDWRRRLLIAAEQFERRVALQEARRAEDFEDIARRAAPTREAIEKAETALGPAAMHALAAFLD